MPSIRAVFFDLDDTLCDARTAFARAAELSFDAIQARYSHLSTMQIKDAWQSIHIPLMADLAAEGLSMAQVRLSRFRHLLAALGHPDDAFADEMDLLLGHNQLGLLKQFDGVTGTLNELRERGFHIGIITNGAGDTHPDSQRSKAEHLGLLKQVDSFWVSDEMGCRKPQRGAFLPPLESAGCKPEEAVYIGDSLENDIAGANGVGITSVLFDPGADFAARKFVDIKPRYVIKSVTEVIPLVASINPNPVF